MTQELITFHILVMEVYKLSYRDGIHVVSTVTDWKCSSGFWECEAKPNVKQMYIWYFTSKLTLKSSLYNLSPFLLPFLQSNRATVVFISPAYTSLMHDKHFLCWRCFTFSVCVSTRRACNKGCHSGTSACSFTICSPHFQAVVTEWSLFLTSLPLRNWSTVISHWNG